MGPTHAAVTTLLLALCFALAGCAPCALGRGIHHYENARFPEALAELEQLAGRGASLSDGEFARYALYRGLTEMALGNAYAAHGWLSCARRLLRQEPALLEATDRARLALAWQSLGYLPAQER